MFPNSHFKCFFGAPKFQKLSHIKQVFYKHKIISQNHCGTSRNWNDWKINNIHHVVFSWRHHFEKKVITKKLRNKFENSCWINFYYESVTNNPWPPDFAWPGNFRKWTLPQNPWLYVFKSFLTARKRSERGDMKFG